MLVEHICFTIVHHVCGVRGGRAVHANEHVSDGVSRVSSEKGLLKTRRSEGFSTEGFFGLGTCSCSLFLGFMNEMTWG